MQELFKTGTSNSLNTQESLKKVPVPVLIRKKHSKQVPVPVWIYKKYQKQVPVLVYKNDSKQIPGNSLNCRTVLVPCTSTSWILVQHLLVFFRGYCKRNKNLYKTV